MSREDESEQSPESHREAHTHWEKPSANSTDSDSDVQSGDADWEFKEIGSSYPVGDNYHCNVCQEFGSTDISDLKEHITTHESVSWEDYVRQSALHRCAGCGDGLPQLTDLYCKTCTQTASDRIPCRNCATTRVNVSNPFCSAKCAGIRVESTTGPVKPLSQPVSPDSDWLDHPHRLPTGIPSAAPVIENNRLVCRECYQYGSDGIHDFAVHVSQRHELEWAQYIQKYSLRRCRVCNDALRSLFPFYCSDECKRADPEPVNNCDNGDCGATVERGQHYCSRDCFYDSVRSSSN